jgi:hypothetical protein
MLKKLLVSAVLAVAFACSAGNVVAQQTDCQRCASVRATCERPCLNKSGDAREECFATCESTENKCLEDAHCPPSQTLTLPKLRTCGNLCIAKATQAWADAAAKCDGLSGKELQQCGRDAEAIFEQTLRDCRRQQNCPPVRGRKK